MLHWLWEKTAGTLFGWSLGKIIPGGQPDERREATEKAIDEAQDQFHERYGDQFGEEGNTFIERRKNHQKLLKSTFPSQHQSLEPQDLDGRGFHGAPEATREARAFFLRSFQEALDTTDDRDLDLARSVQDEAQRSAEIREGVQQLLSLESNAELLKSWWIRWTGATRPNLSSELIIGGRSNTVEDIQSWVAGDPDILSLTADSKDEALAFFAASLLRLSDENDLLSKCLLIGDQATWQEVIEAGENFLVVPLFDFSGEAVEATQRGHHVFVPRHRSLAPANSGDELPRLQVDAARKALEDLGISTAEAQKYAAIARRSLLSLRRVLAREPSLAQPDWAQPDQAENVLPALLAGRWSEGKEGDREVLAELADTEYEEYSRELKKLTSEPDPPVRKSGSVWLTASKWDAWNQTSHVLTLDDWVNFEDIVMGVLGNADIANQEEHSTVRHSKHLREGLADTLAFISGEVESGDYQRRAQRIAQRLLIEAEGDQALWAALSDVLPLIAEAAPNSFLEAVEKGISGDNQLLRHLFQDDKGFSPLMSHSSPHTGLLWALESLAWSKEYFGHSTQLLASLSQMDPGGRLANRPQNSLERIFSLWLPQTSAPLDQRLEAIDVLREREPEIAWNLMVNVIPKSHGHATQTPTHTPEWRNWNSDSFSRPPSPELFRGINELADRTIADVGRDGEKWNELMSKFPSLPPGRQDIIIGKLGELANSSLDPKTKEEIHEVLQGLISHHRGYPEEDWSMPESRIEQLSDVADQFDSVPTAWQEKHLFDHGALTPFDGDFDAKAEELKSSREEAITAILEDGGLDQVLDLAGDVDRPDSLGRALGRVRLSPDSEDKFLEKYLAASDSAIVELAGGYVIGLIEQSGRETAVEVIEDGIDQQWSTSTTGKYMQTLPPGEWTWDLLERLSEKVDGLEQIYWKGVRPERIPEDADLSYAAGKLREYERAHRAVDLLGLYCRNECFPIALIVEVLEQAAEVSPQSGMFTQMFDTHVRTLLEYLKASDEIDNQTVASLEWMYLPILISPGSPESTIVLQDMLAQDPGFFVQVMSLTYLPEEEKEEVELSQDDQARARVGWNLLNSWTTVPGTQEDGSIDEDELLDWIEVARQLLAQEGRESIGERVIGQVLFHGGDQEEDDEWPPGPIRNVLEETDSENIEKGFRIEAHNSRGAHPVSSELEYSLAERYQAFAENLSTQWPRTARMLRNIAEDFEDNARRYEAEAELREDLRR